MNAIPTPRQGCSISVGAWLVALLTVTVVVSQIVMAVTP